MFTWLWENYLKPFVYKIPLFIIIFFFFLIYYFSTDKKDFSFLLLCSFLFERAGYFFAGIFFGRARVNLFERYQRSSYYLEWLILWSNIKQMFNGKLENKVRIETSLVRFKLKNIPLYPKDIIYLRLSQRCTQLIKEITQLSNDICKADNIDNMLYEKFGEKLREYNDIQDKYSKHTINR
uniref:Uncharacterized protein n=1 Tax=Rhynchobrunnera orthospora TaxID=210010 RepID=V5W649_9HELO|nr:hypothetical protein [Rhynchobrunnera orthospora]AHC02406.1 hypothetical protein [Rhynchobrunnera orthospora]